MTHSNAFGTAHPDVSHFASIPTDQLAEKSTETLSRWPSINRFLLCNVVLVLGGLSAIFSPIPFSAILTLIVGIVLCGWAESDNACGTSHIATLTPLVVFTSPPALWLKAVSAYTLGGIISASCVGWIIALANPLTSQGLNFPIAVMILAGCALFMMRDVGAIRFSIPQLQRQTNKIWSFQFGFVPAAAMWGSHIGIGFITVISHGGIFLVAIMSLILDTYGKYLLALFWIGRTLPIWLAPVLAREVRHGHLVQEELLQPRTTHRLVSVVGLLCISIFVSARFIYPEFKEVNWF